MGLEIKQLNPPADNPASHVIIEEKLWLDESRERLLPDGHPVAYFLFAVPGDEVLRSDAARYGLIKGEKPPADAEQSESGAGGQEGKLELPDEKAKREVWDAVAKGLGIDPAEHKKKADLIAAVKAHAEQDESGADGSEDGE
jgi:hypothetical protein